MSEFVEGLRGFGRAARIVRKNRPWALLFLPGLVALLYFPLGIVSGTINPVELEAAA